MVTTSASTSRQAGSLVTFLVVGVLLLGLALGGVYAVKQRRSTQVATTNGNTQIDDQADQQDQQSSDEQKQAEEQRKQEEQKKQEEARKQEEAKKQEEERKQQEQANNQNQQQSGSTQGDTDNQTPAPAPSTPAPVTGPTETPAQISSTGPSGSDTSAIPATGPADQIFSVAAGFVALTLIGIQYRRSRRNYIDASINNR